eukprot:CAMPEP_0180654316 /NCGR_PEP_ID=MMETSP1037_2-20121125/54612_1 /TAXON_ID=632150 /ORGANISM="Azadinium spinosum, Strain 3D9" /LENGTH=54 /DNA_ID=CAMNT_0022680541 /DNA_START=28 /DNA_END=188 /DNA_ORIENTATION=+
MSTLMRKGTAPSAAYGRSEPAASACKRNRKTVPGGQKMVARRALSCRKTKHMLP